MATSGPSWADIQDEEEEEGIRTVTDIVERDGKKFKVTKKVRQVTRTWKVSRAVEERKKWKPFGLAVKNDVGITELGDPVFLDLEATIRKKSQKQKEVDKKAEELIRAASLRAEAETRAGGGGSVNPSAALSDEGETSTAGSRWVGKKSRGGEEALLPGTMPDHDQPRIKVSNLPERCDENDLWDLFSSYAKRGKLNRPQLRAQRGFAFVTFSHREDAERAMAELSRYKMDHNVLHLEWAARRP